MDRPVIFQQPTPDADFAAGYRAGADCDLAQLIYREAVEALHPRSLN